MASRHSYRAAVTWTGNRGDGTASYAAYGRDYTVAIAGKPDLLGSSDPAFRGDPARYNPEDLLVASLSACHMLWYLHLAAQAGLVVTAYRDDASGTMEVGPGGGGRFTGVVLRPTATVEEPFDRERASSLHQRAHAMCFIANSVTFPVTCEPIFK